MTELLTLLSQLFHELLELGGRECGGILIEFLILPAQ